MQQDRRENFELFTESQKLQESTDEKRKTKDSVVSSEPADGGLKAYSVALASFLTNGLLFGIINSCSVFYESLPRYLGGSEYVKVKTSLAGALAMGMTFLLSPLSGVLIDFLGLRTTAVLGGCIATAGMLLSAFVLNNIDAFCFTYGLIFGLGASLAYTPSLAILGQYFKKKLGVVNGFVTVGSSIFTIIISSLMEYMIKKISFEWMFGVLSIFTAGTILCGLMFKPVIVVNDKPLKSDNSCKALLKRICSVQMWKIKKYRLWAFSLPVALFGYFVLFVHIKEFVKLNFTNVNENLPLQCIAATSAVGRITFGTIADRNWVDKIFLQQISFYAIGTLIIILPFVGVFWAVVVVALGIGLFDGAFIALIGPIAFEFVGPAYAAQAIGCMLGLAALPLSAGPPIATFIYHKTQSYTLPFVLAGVSPLVGATFMFLIRFANRGRPSGTTTNTNGHVISTNEMDLESAPTLPSNGHVSLLESH